MQNKTTLQDFNFTPNGYGHYSVTYTSPKTGKVFNTVTNNMPLIDATKNEDSPKLKSLNALKALCKNALLMCCFVLFASLSFAQNAKKDAQGNYTAITALKDSTPAKATGNTFTDAKGVVYPVYVSKNGKLFYTRKSKSGNEYKVYIKL